MLFPTVLPICVVGLTTTGGTKESDDWTARSNTNAKVLLDVMARFNPEAAAFWGVQGVDEEIFQLPLDVNQQTIRANEVALKIFRERLQKETHAAVREDIEILIDAAEESIEGTRLNEKYELPYFNVAQTIFQGLRLLLDDQVAPQRRPAALVRLERYTGARKGYTPITEQAIAFTRAHFDKDLRGPFKDNVEKDLANAPRFVEGIGQLFRKYEIAGYEKSYTALQTQLAAYEEFVKREVLPRTSDDYKQPRELYEHGLKQYGIDMPVDELMSRAKVTFRETQNEMQAVAELIAKERGFSSADYRDVIRGLKKEQITGEAILPHYQKRIGELERLIEQNNVVALPRREMRFRLASEAESAAVPAPHMRPPRLIGNTGEMGEFILPLRIPSDEGTKDIQFDDFSFDAASWTLTVHEGRPGHEMQFASIVEKGVSQARALFAFNSVNVEGWALYCEAEMKPYMPLDGQLISLQHRLLRAARAFIDPGLQLGDLTPEEAIRILEDDVVVSPAMAMQEVERYTFRAPGQATSYFCGYMRLMELRTDAEQLLGKKFDRAAYHDFILSQGLLPPRLLRKAVIEGFVASL